MTPEQSTQLREPFPDSAVGQLPRITCGKCSKAPSRNCDSHSKSKCKVCGNYITSAHLHLDYVGHAACTDRLLKVDPEWTWEPLAYTPQGLPLVEGGAMWIKLTVCGVTRLGVGDAQGKTGPDALKEMIGDALRNAAMRFGVALDLWAKGDLHADDAPDEAPKARQRPTPVPSRPAPAPVATAPPAPATEDAAYTEADLTAELARAGLPPSKAFMQARRLATSLGEEPPLELARLEPGVVMDALVAWLKDQAA